MTTPTMLTPDIIIPSNKKNLVFDATMLSSLQGCGRFVDLRFNHNLISKRGKSNSFEVGSVVHKVFETFYAHIAKGFKRPLAIDNGMLAGQLYIAGCKTCSSELLTKEVIQMVQGKNGTFECGHKLDEYPGVKNTPPDSDKKYTGWKWALSTCEQYFEFYKNDFWVPLETEVVKGEVLYEDDNIRILWKAKLDLTVDTNQGIYPVDHKTSKQRRDTLSLSNQFMGQAILMRSNGAIKNNVGFQKTLPPEEKFTREMMSYSHDRLFEWQSEILPTWAYKYLEYLETGYWTPNFSHCDGKFGKCVYHKICESERSGRESVINQDFIVGPVWDIEPEELVSEDSE